FSAVLVCQSHAQRQRARTKMLSGCSKISISLIEAAAPCEAPFHVGGCGALRDGLRFQRPRSAPHSSYQKTDLSWFLRSDTVLIHSRRLALRFLRLPLWVTR